MSGFDGIPFSISLASWFILGVSVRVCQTRTLEDTGRRRLPKHIGSIQVHVMYIHAHTHACMHVHTHAHTHKYTHGYTHTHTSLHILAFGSSSLLVTSWDKNEVSKCPVGTVGSIHASYIRVIILNNLYLC